MFLLTFLLQINYNEKFFYNDYKATFTAKYPSFIEGKWATKDFTKDSNSIHIPAGKKTPGDGAITSIKIEPQGYTTEYVRLTCPSVGKSVRGAECYVDATGNESPAFQYGIIAQHGKDVTVKISRSIKNQTAWFAVYVYNKNMEKEAIFGIPTIEYVNPVDYPLDSISTIVEGHEDMTIETFKVTEKPIFLNTMPLLNPYKPPKTIKEYNILIPYGVREEYSKLILLANKTHIVGFNILQDEFMHIWHVINNEKYMSFSMHLRARNSTGANISYILWRHESESWEDAVEHWHQEFPDIYNKQIGGWGFWTPFSDLNKVFPDTNDEIDLFHVGFQWGSPKTTKRTVPNWCYVEPTMIHIDIPYRKDHVLEDLKKCEYDPALGKSEAQKKALKVKCEAIIDSAARKSDLSLLVFEENAPWNKGMAATVYFGGKAKDYFVKSVDDSYEPDRYAGIALDSFGNNRATYIDEENGYTPGIDDIPYYLVNEGNKPFIPTWSGLFNAIKYWKGKSPKGLIVNSNYVMPEMQKNIANIGNELRIGNEELGCITDPTDDLNVFWTSRYTAGSRSISFVDNSNREKSLKYKEEYFSIMASFGSASSWFSGDAANNNLWTSKKDIDDLRPFMKRWMPALNESLNGSIFYANNLGIVKTIMAEDKQVPKINANDISTTSLWCKPKETAVDGYVDCYAFPFIGYKGAHNEGENFHREARIEIDGIDKQCIFSAEKMTCKVNDDKSVTVAVHGVPSNTVYRTSIIKFKRKLRNNYPDYITELESLHITAGDYEASKFNSNTYEYTINLVNSDDLSSIPITATLPTELLSNNAVTMNLDNKELKSNEPFTLDLSSSSPGSTIEKKLVISPISSKSHYKECIYTLKFVIPLKAKLESLSITAGDYEASKFNSNTYEYTINLVNSDDLSSIPITATLPTELLSNNAVTMNLDNKELKSNEPFTLDLSSSSPGSTIEKKLVISPISPKSHYKECIYTLKFVIPFENESSINESSTKAIIIGGISAGAVVLIIAVVITSFILCRKHKEESSPPSDVVLGTLV